MKHFLLLTAMIFVLAACSGQVNSTEETPSDNQGQTAKQSQDNNDKSKGKDNKGSQESENEPKDQNTQSGNDQQKQNQDEGEKAKQGDNNQKGDAEKNPEPKYKVNPDTWYIEPISDADPKVVLLTIDDAPDEHAVEMAKTLQELNAPAIFFINGIYVDTKEGKQKLKKIHDLGFSIGDHTWTHPYLTKLSKEEQTKEITRVYETIKDTLGNAPEFFRAPFGENTDVSYQLSKKYNMLVMNWSYGYDWNKEYEDPESLTEIMVNTPLLHSGAILLMHDRDWTAKALDDIVKGLRKKGYKFLDPALLKTPN